MKEASVSDSRVHNDLRLQQPTSWNGTLAMTSGSETTASLTDSFPQCLFPVGYRLVPGLREVYELQLARLEAAVLTRQQLVDQGAYFSSVDGISTRHLLTCLGETLKLPEYSSSRLKAFFANNSFRTGYATHGLFPYRGKFHPQMVRGILNAMGLTQGQVVLDPMMGSGTLPVEASLMGINAVGFDASPFCVFMTETKMSALTMSLERTAGALRNVTAVYSYFAKKYGVAHSNARVSPCFDESLSRVMEEGDEYALLGQRFRNRDTADTYALLLLAFLDGMGYAQRTARRDPLDLFRGILERYLNACKKFQTVLHTHNWRLGDVVVRKGDARAVDIDDSTIDGILFSPPYSFAIDYVANDTFHLDALGVNRRDLYEIMIGIRGGARLADKFACYIEDMRQVLRECHRVLRPGRYCVIVIGTNSNQLSKVLKTPREGFIGLHEIIRNEAQSVGLTFVTEIERVINGISNTMREEFIVFLRKGV